MLLLPGINVKKLRGEMRGKLVAIDTWAHEIGSELVIIGLNAKPAQREFFQFKTNAIWMRRPDKATLNMIIALEGRLGECYKVEVVRNEMYVSFDKKRRRA